MTLDRYKFDNIVDRHCDNIVDWGGTYIDLWHSMRWVVMPWGFVIETICEDDNRTTTYETLIAFNRKKAVLIHRYREGLCHDEMKRYLRDEQYPIPCRVRLLPCSLKS